MNPKVDSLMSEGEGIVLFRPYVSPTAAMSVAKTLSTRWIGQGPQVEEFERQFSTRLAGDLPCAATNSGTSALHLAMLLAGIGPGDEVITTIFTCTATNMPVLYCGATPVFADIQPTTLNIDPVSVRAKLTEKTKAIVCVPYGGLPCDMDELRQIADEAEIPLIQDAAHAMGAQYHGVSIVKHATYSMFSFQAIKHFTTGDGGMLVLPDHHQIEDAKLLRWFGIDRSAKQKGIWENDITRVGYKYQMTDIAATMGLAALGDWDTIWQHRRKLLALYELEFDGIDTVEFVGGGFDDRTHAAWLCTVLVDDRVGCQAMLRSKGIEATQVHYRNDRYSIMGGRRDDMPGMDSVDDKYLVLPMHMQVTEDDVYRITDALRTGW